MLYYLDDFIVLINVVFFLGCNLNYDYMCSFLYFFCIIYILICRGILRENDCI